VRIGGSYNFDVGDNTVVARGGIGYDTAAARTGWERADLDGAARTMISAGGSYKLKKWSFDAGFGVILEGTRTQNRNCDPTGATGSIGCSGNGDAPADGYGQGAPTRQGPDPINPIIDAGVQSEKPVNQGTFTSHYIMIMLGASTWF
jgi:long-subunit fatty acid transport protein